uniref:Uncharacterized protein n=1 Tax=Chelonoidis abingdonii TaxID=106734 RepID=A0A8C0JAH7_CHEAB
MLSMDWPFSRRFSISISSFTPSTTICTSSTSEKPSRSALETSNTPPTAAVSTPPEERGDSAGGGDVVSGGKAGQLARKLAGRQICPKPCTPASRDGPDCMSWKLIF